MQKYLRLYQSRFEEFHDRLAVTSQHQNGVSESNATATPA